MRLAIYGTVLAAGLLSVDARADAEPTKAACIASSEQAQKLLDDRRLLFARNKFLECAAESCPAAVRSDCAAQVEQLKKNIPTLVFRVKGDNGDLTQGDVFLDGAQIASKLDGQLVAVDPGAHKVRVVVGDGRSLSQEIVVGPGEQNRTVVFDASTKPAAGAAPVAEAPQPKTHWSTLRTVGFVSMMVGGASVLTGVVTELLALVFESNATTLQGRSGVIYGGSSYCFLEATPPTGDPNCDSAISYHQEALGTQNVAFATLIGGGIVLVGGVVLYLVGGNVPTASKAALRVVPMLGPNVAGLGVSGAF